MRSVWTVNAVRIYKTLNIAIYSVCVVRRRHVCVCSLHNAQGWGDIPDTLKFAPLFVGDDLGINRAFKRYLGTRSRYLVHVMAFEEMKFSTKLGCAFRGKQTLLALLILVALAPRAQAAWQLVRADAHPVAIHDAGLYQPDIGQHFGVDDILETPASGGIQIQDDAGNVVALGRDTRVMLLRDAHIALLQGWMKVRNACDAKDCAALVVETEHTRFSPAGNTALVIAVKAAGYQGTDAVFCESGMASVSAIANSYSKTVPVRVDTHGFATHSTAQAPVTLAAQPDSAFIASMPVAFRDALRPLPALTAVPNDLPKGTRPVAYDDVSDWLESSLAARTAPSTRFTARFRARLSDAAFEQAIKQNIRVLPDWRPLVYPPPRVVAHSTVFQQRQPYSPDSVHP